MAVGRQEGVLAILHCRTRRRKAFQSLIVPASTFGSLGDLAMIEGLHDARGIEHPKIVAACVRLVATAAREVKPLLDDVPSKARSKLSTDSLRYVSKRTDVMNGCAQG